MSQEHETRPNATSGPGIGMRLILAAIVGLALLALVMKQAY
jgi:hypothetical protein